MPFCNKMADTANGVMCTRALGLSGSWMASVCGQDGGLCNDLLKAGFPDQIEFSGQDKIPFLNRSPESHHCSILIDNGFLRKN